MVLCPPIHHPTKISAQPAFSYISTTSSPPLHTKTTYSQVRNHNKIPAPPKNYFKENLYLYLKINYITPASSLLFYFSPTFRSDSSPFNSPIPYHHTAATPPTAARQLNTNATIPPLVKPAGSGSGLTRAPSTLRRSSSPGPILPAALPWI